jgi:outer membrane lipoprotein-sorting protein
MKKMRAVLVIMLIVILIMFLRSIQELQAEGEDLRGKMEEMQDYSESIINLDEEGIDEFFCNSEL